MFLFGPSCPLALAKAHAWATTIFVNKFDALFFAALSELFLDLYQRRLNYHRDESPHSTQRIIYFDFLGFCRLRSLTPGPPPFSARNSIPAATSTFSIF